jgi:NADPH-dependent glutamate synthase beta subunit-like oxidoreductase
MLSHLYTILCTLSPSFASHSASNGPGVKVPAAQKLKIAIIGAGLGGMITAMDLSEAGHDVEIFEARRFVGGKVSIIAD